MHWTDFVGHVRNGVGDVDERAIIATLDGLARFVPEIDARQMRANLPDEVARRLANDTELETGVATLAPPDLPRDLGLSEGHAVELLETVCRVIDDALDPEGRLHFRRNLSDDLVATFERAHELRSPPVGTGHELSDGRPGSARPLSGANPAQSDSIARGGDPHGRSKLSGAEGTTQEIQHRTIAEGEPGSTRPLSTHKP